MSAKPRVGLVGIRGFGEFHLANVERLHDAGRVAFAGCADIVPPDDRLAERISRMGGRYFSDYEQMLASAEAEIVIVSTPPHDHAWMTCAALRAGAHVLVEKPPAAKVEDIDAMSAAAAGRLCQVGFQSLGSGAIARIAELVAAGTIGAVERVGAAGCWVRDDAYYRRAPWAGRRYLNGAVVTDGALSNPFAHAIMNCLVIAGVSPDEVIEPAAELFRTRPIEVEDTGCLRVAVAARPTITVAVTLCAPRDDSPYVEVNGSDGAIRWWYESDRICVAARDATSVMEELTRGDLLENLIDVASGKASHLFCPIERTRVFVAITEWLGRQPVYNVPSLYVIAHDGACGSVHEIAGVAEAVEKSAADGLLFSEFQAPPPFLSAVTL